ncbi:hypothetical protein ceV_434 [Chrysochromulina ericina virus CeV-01B]|uniref:Uncharacterized protein n=1 Tax=Chrysochromulina ericina virus CeV-01B TaxID=3070830 RepID=A0A0N9R487_9VIRU|nr:hypothetical protein ceV_434 [Chrysochromulina ericina virus]ALH23340.1 hypothetical protein ceV_434 [Chrysochromulina ericina virus CeV-01B]
MIFSLERKLKPKFFFLYILQHNEGSSRLRDQDHTRSRQRQGQEQIQSQWGLFKQTSQAQATRERKKDIY